MMRRLVLRAHLIAVLCVVALGPRMARGQISSRAPKGPAREKTLSEALQGAAKEAYTSATMLFNNGDFGGALAKYGQAYDESRDPRLLFNMAICYKNQRGYARMQGLLQRFERESGPSLSPVHRAAADNALDATKNLVGTVNLSVNVAGAAVTVDGEIEGTTPLEKPLVLDLGKHSLTFSVSGFDPVTKSIEIAGGAQQSLDVTLVRSVLTGQLLVTSDPEATIVIDGSSATKERFDGRLPAGPHEIRVTEPGKLPYRAEVDLHERETRTVQVTLTNEPHGSAIWPWIVGGVVVAGGAAVGGYFLFKPSDTRTNPVPAGTLASTQFALWKGQ